MTGPQDQAPVPPVTKPVTYEELTPEHKQKYDEVKAQFEADLIGSFERTRSHGYKIADLISSLIYVFYKIG